MDRIQLRFADSFLNAYYDSQLSTWKVTVEDLPTGKAFQADWTPDQLGAVVQLMVFGDDGETIRTRTNKELYAIANPLFEGRPRECRCIP